ncbi:hypothetical protein BD413DRAFT_554475 [Trametes elegans]|nr:hypothetical protein BD413DRAFT_554475 [Trametes elegans]
MEEEIEETQRQISRSTELIRSAFEGLTTLHSRVTEASFVRAQGRLLSGPDNVSGSAPPSGRNAMDPGHHAILLSSPAQMTSSSTTLSSLPVAATPSPPESSLQRRMSESELSTLRTEIVTSTESVRQRASELDQLRRAIVQHTSDRRRQLARLTAANNQSRSSLTADASSQTELLAGTTIPPRSRRLLLESSLRQLGSEEPSTSLGALVSARTSSTPSAEHTTHISAGNNHGTASFLSTSVPAAIQVRSPASPIPSGIATRLSRLAQEIQQDISRISQQSESLMSWIDEHRARLDAAAVTSTRPLGRTADRPPSPSANRTPRPSHATPAMGSSTSSEPPSTTSNTPARTTPSGSRVFSMPIRSLGTSSTSSSDRGDAAAVSAHPTPIRPRRMSDIMRRQYLRGSRMSAPTGLSARSGTGDEDGDGPLSRSSRMDGAPSREPPPPPAMPDATSALAPDRELVDAVFRVRGALARARDAHRAPEGGENEDETEPTETRSYRVRRRLNADGDEVVQRVPTRREPALREGARRRGGSSRNLWATEEEDAASDRRQDRPFSEAVARPPERPRRTSWFREEDGPGGDTEWLEALARLDALSQDAAVARTERERRERPGRNDLSYPVNLGGIQPSRWSRQSTETSTEDYDAVMRTRALALAGRSSSPQAAGGSGTTATPPLHVHAQTTRPLSFMPTTQTTPGSLWNDSNVRVRIRAAVARVEEDMRALDAAWERALPGPPAQAPAPSRSQRQQVRPPFVWPFDPSPSPPLERSSAAEPETQMWGSPVPFCPSLLPLPRVEDVDDLQARSRAFGGAKKVARMPRRRSTSLAGR